MADPVRNVARCHVQQLHYWFFTSGKAFSGFGLVWVFLIDQAIPFFFLSFYILFHLVVKTLSILNGLYKVLEIVYIYLSDTNMFISFAKNQWALRILTGIQRYRFEVLINF